MLWLLGWLALVFVGAIIVVRMDIAQRREVFQADARIVHGILSQRAVQHEAILATLNLLGAGRQAEQRLPAVYPQVIAALSRDEGDHWRDAALQEAEQRSRAAHHAVLGGIDAAAGQYTLVLAGEPASFALRIDVQRLVASDAWPLARSGPVRVTLNYADHVFVLQRGERTAAQPLGLTEGFAFAKPLSAASQPFELHLSRATGPVEWPWNWLLAWAAFSALAMAALASSQHARRARRRAEELLRVGRIARLNTLGELAGGIAHELNQPLTAILAGTQAARRLLDDEPPALATAQQAISQAATQARRAADVVARLRRLVESPDAAQARQPVQLAAALRNVLNLLDPELRQRGIVATVLGAASAVSADPAALEQIMHNLVGNAVQALDEVATEKRKLVLHLQQEHEQGVLTVHDSGPGIAAEALDHVFEPFYTTRRGGLGLGLSLCETLAQAMQGTLTARNADTGGAEFRLALPLAKTNA